MLEFDIEKSKKEKLAGASAFFSTFLGFTAQNLLAFLFAPFVIGFSLLHMIISVIGSVCGGGVNFFATIESFKDFIERLPGGEKWKALRDRKKLLLNALLDDIKVFLELKKEKKETNTDPEKENNPYIKKMLEFLGKINCDISKNFNVNAKLSEIQAKIKHIDRVRERRKYIIMVIFIVTSVLFGLCAFAFGFGTLYAVGGIIAGFLVCLATMFQETGAWMESFDPTPDYKLDYFKGTSKDLYKELVINENDNARQIDQKNKQLQLLFELEELPKSWTKRLKDYWALNVAKSKKSMVGLFIAFGNNVGLSLLFTFGLVTFLIACHILPLLPAFIISVAISFSFGFFTESYFYNQVIPRFTHNFTTEFHKLFFYTEKDKTTGKEKTRFHKKGLVGLFISLLNAGVNGLFSYLAIISLTLVLASVFPPLAVVFAFSVFGAAVLPAVISTFCTVCSFFLGISFWNRKMAYKEPKTEIKMVEYEVYVDKSTDSVQLGNSTIGAIFLQLNEVNAVNFIDREKNNDQLIRLNEYLTPKLVERFGKSKNEDGRITDEILIKKLIREIKLKGKELELPKKSQETDYEKTNTNGNGHSSLVEKEPLLAKKTESHSVKPIEKFFDEKEMHQYRCSFFFNQQPSAVSTSSESQLQPSPC